MKAAPSFHRPWKLPGMQLFGLCCSSFLQEAADGFFGAVVFLGKLAEVVPVKFPKDAFTNVVGLIKGTGEAKLLTAEEKIYPYGGIRAQGST